MISHQVKKMKLHCLKCYNEVEIQVYDENMGILWHNKSTCNDCGKEWTVDDLINPGSRGY